MIQFSIFCFKSLGSLKTIVRRSLFMKTFHQHPLVIAFQKVLVAQVTDSVNV